MRIIQTNQMPFLFLLCLLEILILHACNNFLTCPRNIRISVFYWIGFFQIVAINRQACVDLTKINKRTSEYNIFHI